jgi:hypothetical protein
VNERYIIDRVEGNYVIIEKENKDIRKICIENIKGDFKEGDILISKDNEYFEIDKRFTLNRKKQIDEIMEDMWKE